MKKVLLTTVMSLMMCLGVFAQDYMNAPKAGEKVLGTISTAGPGYYDGMMTSKNVECSSCFAYKSDWYKTLLEKAKQEYSNIDVDIRSMEVGRSGPNPNTFYGSASGKVVDLHDPEAQTYVNLSQALNKALRNVREGSRVAIDQVTVITSMDREDFKDQLIDVLLDKGYKVVAKEYLEKLYEEQQGQQSGIYNENTTVKENNFSAVGYYINVKVTETSLRVQVVNVSTGEYEGNATVNF